MMMFFMYVVFVQFEKNQYVLFLMMIYKKIFSFGPLGFLIILFCGYFISCHYRFLFSSGSTTFAMSGKPME